MSRFCRNCGTVTFAGGKSRRCPACGKSGLVAAKWKHAKLTGATTRTRKRRKR